MRRFLISALLATLVLSPRAFAADDQLFSIASMLSGTFEGSTPGNHLRLNISNLAIDPQHPFDLFLAVSGQFEKDNVRQQGVIRLERQGTDVYFTYIPHFDPAITALSQDAGRFTERELTSAIADALKGGWAPASLATPSAAPPAPWQCAAPTENGRSRPSRAVFASATPRAARPCGSSRSEGNRKRANSSQLSAHSPQGAPAPVWLKAVS